MSEPDIEAIVQIFKHQAREPARLPGVYALYDAETGEPLYVGQSKNLHSRIYDHHTGTGSGKDLIERIRADDDPPLELDDGSLWGLTEAKYVALPGTTISKRNEIEQAIEDELKPYYESR